MVSAPVPVVMVLAPEEPVIESDAERPAAFTFWKLLTAVESPDVWSPLARLTVAAVAIVSVLVPEPPSIEVSLPR